jgi:sec-independent protein translocase protein TatC
MESIGVKMKEMSFVDHLEELRRSIINILIILSVGFFVAYGLGEQISEILLSPLREVLRINHGTIVYLGLFDKVVSELQLALWADVILTSPLWFYQIWKFITPGLHSHEIKAIKPFLILGFFLFCLGVCFGYFVLFPFFFKLLIEYGVKDVYATIALKEYLISAVKVLFFLGIIFQVPNAILIMGLMGIVTKQSLRSIRRYVYVGLSVAAAVFSPPDVMSMVAIWIPLIVLYEVGIVAVALVVHPYLAKRHSS